MVDVVNLNDRRKPVDTELVESLRVLLSEAQNGRMTGIVAAYYDDEGNVCTTYHMGSAVDAIAATAVLHADVLGILSEE